MPTSIGQINPTSSAIQPPPATSTLRPGADPSIIIIEFASGPVTVPILFIPGEFQDNYSAQYVDTQIIARSEPIRGYSSGGPRTFSFLLIFHANEEAWSDVYQQIKYLRAATYPQYGAAGYMAPPPLIRVLIGRWMAIRGFMRDSSLTWKAPYTSPFVWPHHAEMNFTVEELNTTARGAADIAANNGFSNYSIQQLQAP